MTMFRKQTRDTADKAVISLSVGGCILGVSRSGLNVENSQQDRMTIGRL